MRLFALGLFALTVALPACNRSSAAVRPDSGASACAATLSAPAVDPALVPPGGPLRVLAQGSATGTQNYVCGRPEGDRAAAPSWSPAGPDATLTDCHGSVFARHFASEANQGGAAAPRWEAHDGSFVVAKKVAAASAKEPNAVPWLLLEVTSHGGSGVLGGVSYVQRTKTSGGAMPSGGCEEARVGTVAKVPYSADYWFLGK